MLTLRSTTTALAMALAVATPAALSAQHEAPALQNAFLRPHTDLNGSWKYFVDRYESFFYDFGRVPFDSSGQGRGDFAAMDARATDRTQRYEYGFDDAEELAVPGDWNHQDERLLYYEGSIWYRRTFDDPRGADTAAQRLLLRFGAANYRADVYVNGEKAGVHEGGFTPFQFDVSTLVRDTANSLVVRVDNQRHREAVPTDVTDWWNYGGLTRDVALYTLPATYISDYSVQLAPGDTGTLAGYVQLHGPDAADAEAHVRIPALDLDLHLRTDAEGVARFRESVSGPHLWSPDDPYRYAVTVSAGADSTTDRIGLRTVTTRGHEILVNGRPTFLRGICAHEENPLEGRRANGYADAALLMGWARGLDANFMRLAHYPHSEYMPRLADSLGILLWEEIPVYWTIAWENPATYANAEAQLEALVARDRNRASVIIWSMANETPDTEARLTFLRKLADRARALDSTRLISAALFKAGTGPHRYEVRDPFAAYADVVSFNEYIGWYEGLPSAIDSAAFSFRQNKPVIISEFGGGAKGGMRGDSLTRWSEDFQASIYRATIRLVERTPEVAGMTPWILADFRSPRRNLPGIQDGWNRKGLVSQQGEEKLAYGILRDFYTRRAASAGGVQAGSTKASTAKPKR